MREGVLVRSAHAGLVEFRRLRAVYHHPNGGVFAVLRDDRPMGDAADGMPPHMAFRPAGVFRHTPLFRNLHHCHVEGPVVLRGRVDVDVADFRPGGIEGACPSNRESLAACIRPLVPGRMPVQKQRDLGGDTARGRIGRDGAAMPERIQETRCHRCGKAIAAMLLTGPVFNALGVTPAAKAEGIGIPLNQMGRVAATGGIISDGDERYLNELLPLELYETVYTPTCVDSVKWNPEFNEEALSDDFWRHWLSMGIKNPVTYLESWELQTVGYWSINQPQALSHNRNIAAGVPRNSQDPVSLEAWEIYPQNKLGNDAVHSLLCTDQGFVPIGWLSWFALFAAIALFNCKKSAWFVSLVPTTAIIAALLVASPIWYWERYAVALQFLLPFYVVMLYCTGSVRRRPVPIEQRARLSKIFASPKTRTV